VQKSKMAAAAILDLIFVQYFGIPAAAAILNLLFLSILVKWSISGGSRLHHCKTSLIYVNRRLSY